MFAERNSMTATKLENQSGLQSPQCVPGELVTFFPQPNTATPVNGQQFAEPSVSWTVVVHQSIGALPKWSTFPLHSLNHASISPDWHMQSKADLHCKLACYRSAQIITELFQPCVAQCMSHTCKTQVPKHIVNIRDSTDQQDRLI